MALPNGVLFSYLLRPFCAAVVRAQLLQTITELIQVVDIAELVGCNTH